MTRYLYYRKTNKSAVTISRAILEANNLDWNNGDTIILVFKEIKGKEGLFLRKKDGNELKIKNYYYIKSFSKEINISIIIRPI